MESNYKINHVEKWDSTKSFYSYYSTHTPFVEYNRKFYRAKSFKTEAYYETGIIPSESPEFWQEVDLSEQ